MLVLSLAAAQIKTGLRRGVINIRFFFFFNDTATTEIYTLSLHDALPICWFLPSLERLQDLDDGWPQQHHPQHREDASHHREDHARRRLGGTFLSALALAATHLRGLHAQQADRKSTRLNSSHSQISYAVFC